MVIWSLVFIACSRHYTRELPKDGNKNDSTHQRIKQNGFGLNGLVFVGEVSLGENWLLLHWMKAPLLSRWRGPHAQWKKLLKKGDKDKARTKQRGRGGGGVWVLYCLSLSPPPNTVSLSLPLSNSLSPKATTALGYFCLLLLCFLCNCLCLLLLLPLLSTCKWGRNHTLNFLLLFDTRLFFSSFTPLAEYPSKHDFLVVFYSSASILRLFLALWVPLENMNSIPWFDPISYFL